MDELRASLSTVGHDAARRLQGIQRLEAEVAALEEELRRLAEVDTRELDAHIVRTTPPTPGTRASQRLVLTGTLRTEHPHPHPPTASAAAAI